MSNLDDRGFTLVELLAIVVILGVISLITVPTVTSLIDKNKEDSYKSLEKSIISATKVFISDNRYNITLDNSTICSDSNKTRSIESINTINITDNKITIKVLIDSGNLNEGKDAIINPKNSNEKLNLNNSYVIVEYNCDRKDYDYKLGNLVWE